MKLSLVPTSLLALLLSHAAAAAPEFCGRQSDNLLPQGRQAVFEFSQSKQISTISRPLQSSGLLGLAATGELLWQTTQPLKSTVVIDGGNIRIFNRQDVLVNELANASIKVMSDLLLQVFSGDSAALENSFITTVSCGDDTSWQLDLRPRTAELENLLLSVSLSGRDDLEAIRFQETRGDTTAITLTPVPATRLDELERYLGD